MTKRLAMKQAVVIHPRFRIYGGGEMIALHVIKVLNDLDYSVSIVTDNYNPEEVERNFRMGKIMEGCIPIRITTFKPRLSRFLAAQRLGHASKVMGPLKYLKPDIAFCTQSVTYHVPGVKTLGIVYDMTGLFEIISGAYARGPLAPLWKKPYYWLLRRFLHAGLPADCFLVPLSHALEHQLATSGYPHSPVVFPPCDMIFRPTSKKKQICLVSRIAPEKNIGSFMKIALGLPNYKFILVGIHAEMNPDYAREVLSARPSNVEYVEARIRDRPEIIAESKVYLYTSLEPGIGIALGQAMGAGCIPLTPAFGGGAEMVLETNVGYTYRNTDEAMFLVQKALESEKPRDTSEHIAERSKIFSSERFEERIAEIVRDRA